MKFLLYVKQKIKVWALINKHIKLENEKNGTQNVALWKIVCEELVFMNLRQCEHSKCPKTGFTRYPDFRESGFQTLLASLDHLGSFSVYGSYKMV